MDTPTLVENIRQALETALPPVWEGLDPLYPAITDFTFGEPILGPTVDLPIVGVDSAGWKQESRDFAGPGREEVRDQILIHFAVEAQAPSDAAEQIQWMAESIRSLVEAELSGDATLFSWEVTACDFSPNVRRGNALGRFAVMTVEVVYDREEAAMSSNLGEVPAADRMSYEGNIYTLQRANLSFALTGDNTVVAAPGVGFKLAIIAIYLSPVAGGTVSIAMKMGTTTVFPQTPQAVGSTSQPVLSADGYPLALFVGADNESFKVNLSAAVSTAGFVLYLIPTS